MKFTVKSIALSGVALGMFVTVAHASDSDASSNWTGFSLGVGGGGSFNFSNMDAGGFGAFQVEDGDNNNLWMDGGYLFGSGGGNYGYANTEYYVSGGYTTMWTGAGMGNVGSLVAEVAQALADYDVSVSGSNSGRDLDNEAGMAGFLGTVRGGFDVQLDRLVVGLDAGFNFGKTEINNASEGVAGGSYYIWESGWDASGGSDGESYLNTSLELGNSWTVGGRAGFLATDSTLIFGSAGYVSTHAKLSASFTGRNHADIDSDGTGSGYADARYDISSSDSDWLDGYYFGGGMEQMLTSDVSMKLEYRLSDLGSISTSDVDSREVGNPGGNDGASWIAAVGAHAEPTVHTVTATVNWRF